MMSQKAIVVMHNKASTSRLREIDCQWESRIALVIQNTRGPRNIIGDADYKNYVLHVLWPLSLVRVGLLPRSGTTVGSSGRTIGAGRYSTLRDLFVCLFYSYCTLCDRPIDNWTINASLMPAQRDPC